MNDQHFPHGLTQIAESAGDEAALKIALERGGSRLRIPQKAEGSILEKIVGIDAARKIVKDLADERIEIPLAKKIVAAWLHDQGWSQEAIAVKLKISRRTVQYWQTGTTPTRQSDLFNSL
ncbi:helix-turn-helix domain-containing protein [Thalassospira alkalitolerans]|uniref:helix-turn-helix domain-containing protein n=1 Tax=Thalassospira alkalitolerans TaxID=1293890 RepID=UPI0030EE8146|tara:strand:+ start:1270 stop:1629 length:360 start_codon:yes stop_codon:yes gene_type:complete